MNSPIFEAPGSFVTSVLFAAGVEPLHFILLLIGVISWLGKVIVSANKKVAQKRAEIGGPAPNQAAMAGKRREVEDEISDFLRRAAQKRQSEGARGAAASVPSPAPPTRVNPRQPQRRRAAPPPPPQVVEAVHVDAPPTGEGVAAHVRQHLDTADFAARANKMGNVAQKSRVAMSHLESSFDNEHGTLATSSDSVTSAAAAETPANAGPSTIDRLLTLLQDPQGMRQAVLANEVLRRPTERW